MTDAETHGDTESQTLDAEFKNLVSTALDLHRSGKREEAIELARQAEKIAPQVSRSTDLKVAWAHNFLGFIFFQTTYFRSALEAYRRASKSLGHSPTTDDDLRAALANNLGQVYERLGDLPQAQAHLETAVVMRKAAADETKNLGFALDNLGSVLASRGNLAGAEAMHQDALAIFRRLGGPFDPDLATALGNLSRVFAQQGDFERAEAYRLRSLDANQRVSGLESSPTLLDIANLIEFYWKSGDEERADVFVNHLLSMGGDKLGLSQRDLAEFLRGLLKSAFSRFRLDIAKRLGSRAVLLLEATEGPVAPETLEAVFELASVERALANREAAEHNYHRARSGYELLQMPDKVVAVAIELSKLYRDSGSYPAAAQLLSPALEHLRKSTTRDRQAIASVLGNLGLVHFEAERYEEAERCLVEALGEADDVSKEGLIDRPWLLHNRAMLHYHLGKFESALRQYEEARRLWTEWNGSDHPFVATCWANMALLHWTKGSNDDALAAFIEAETISDHEMQRILTIGSERERGLYAQDLAADLNKVVTFCLAANPRSDHVANFSAQMLLRRKGRVLDAVAHTLNRVRELGSPEDQSRFGRLQKVREEITGLLAPALLLETPTDDTERLHRLRVEEEELEGALSYRGALQDPSIETIALEQVRSRLEPDHALVEFLRFDEFDPKRTGKKGTWKEARYAAMVLRKTEAAHWVDLGSAASIDSRVSEWQKLLRGSTTDISELNAQGSELYSTLIEPIHSAIQGAHRLLISPDGLLALIPFGAMRLPEDRYLKQLYAISYLSTGRDLLRSVPDTADARDVVIIANPDFDFDAAEPTRSGGSQISEEGEFDPLPETCDEAMEIASQFGNPRVVTGAEATTQHLREVRQPFILHVATHGFFSEIQTQKTRWRRDWIAVGNTFAMVQASAQVEIANPMFSSGIVLAGANHPGRGVMTAQEVASLDLRGTALVVLSACETGLGRVKAGTEFAGLRRALAIAGSQTQVTSLWKVGSDATRFLMAEYYQLLATGIGRADALDIAQTRLANAHAEWQHPVFWAAFISAGDFGPVAHFSKRQAHSSRASFRSSSEPGNP